MARVLNRIAVGLFLAGALICIAFLVNSDEAVLKAGATAVFGALAVTSIRLAIWPMAGRALRYRSTALLNCAGGATLISALWANDGFGIPFIVGATSVVAGLALMMTLPRTSLRRAL